MTATATRPRKNREAKVKEPELLIDVPVTFRGVSIQETTVRLGVKIARDNIGLDTADECFCGRRLTGRVQLGGADDQAGQRKLMDDLNHFVEGHFDCKRLGVGADVIGIGLTFNLRDVDIAELAKFSKGTGRLIVNNVGVIPDGDAEAAVIVVDNEDEDDE